MPTRNSNKTHLIGIGLSLLGLAIITLVLLDGFWLAEQLAPPWLVSRSTDASGRRAAEDFLERPLPDGAWPHRRGLHMNAHAESASLDDAWPEEGPTVLWSRDIGSGYSGVIVVGDRAFTQTQALTAQRVLCLNALTGETLWEHRYALPYEPYGMYPGPRATPTWSKGRLFCVSPGGVLLCLDAEDGALLWSADMDERFGLKGVGFGYSASPTVDDRRVYMPVGAKGASIVAFDSATGDVVWQAGDDSASYCGLLPISLRDRKLLVALLEHALVVHDRETGKVLARRELSHGYDEHSAAPLYREPHLVVTSPFRKGAECYELVLNESAGRPASIQLKPAWISERMSCDTASALLVGKHIYGFDLRDVQSKLQRPSRGTFRCLDWATGRQAWQSDAPGHSTAILADEHLVLFNDRGELILADASPDGYQERARTSVFAGEICWTAPAFSRDCVYLRSPTRAACIYLGPGDPAAIAGAGHPLGTTAAMSQPTRFSLYHVMGGERTYMMDPATVDELLSWYAWSLLGVLLPAALLAMAIHAMLPRRWGDRRCAVACRIHGLLLLVGGFVAAPILNRLLGEFLFTWPVGIAASQHMLLKAILRTSKEDKRPSRKKTAVDLGLFLATCGLYFHGCRVLGLANEWMFLMAPAPSWLVALPAAMIAKRRNRLWIDILCFAASFTAFFLVAAVITRWRAV